MAILGMLAWNMSMTSATERLLDGSHGDEALAKIRCNRVWCSVLSAS